MRRTSETGRESLRRLPAKVCSLVALWACLLFLPSPGMPADWVRIDVFSDDERELPNIFLDFDSFRYGGEITTVSARLVNPDSSYVELAVKIKCGNDEFDVPASTFYNKEGRAVNSDPVAQPQWMKVPRGSHIDFIKFFLCVGGRGKSPGEFGRMRGFRDFAVMSRPARGNAP